MSEVQVLIITGMSGAGRSTAGKALEDQGWYVADNVPPSLIDALVSTVSADVGVNRIAVAVDVRGRGLTTTLTSSLNELRQQGITHRMLFLDAQDDTLVRRFESVRRPHPLQAGGRLLDGITKERLELAQLKAASDVLIDTSQLNVHQLTAKVNHAFSDSVGSALRLIVMSFGFKYGLPLDADHVADVRFIPNPFWVPELRPHTGLDAAVRDYVLGAEGASAFLTSYAAALAPVLRGYVHENKRYATIAMGCTGGKHRSVAMTQALAQALSSDDVAATTVHRDLGRE